MPEQLHAVIVLTTIFLAACGGPSPSPTHRPPAAEPPTAAPNPTGTPTFTHPTDITNPYYPVSLIAQAISLGTQGGQSYRTEVTLLLDTKTIRGARAAVRH